MLDHGKDDKGKGTEARGGNESDAQVEEGDCHCIDLWRVFRLI